MDEQKKGFFESLNPKQSFLFGVVGGFLALCVIGFFILLAVMFKGGGLNLAGSGADKELGPEAPKKFSQCLDSGQTASKVSQDQQLGESLGVEGTPATFINGYLISGAYPYEAVKLVLDALLAGQTPSWDEAVFGPLTKVEMPEFTDAIWRGNKNASITMVGFSDFECPYCARFEPTMKQVLANYGDQVRFTYRHFPLSFHPQAQKAAEAFECAKEQNQGWEMHDKLFELSAASQLSAVNFKKAAGELGLK